MKQSLFIALVAVIGLSSCNKKDDPAPTSTQLLSQNTWVLKTLTSTDPNVQSTGQVLLGSEWSFESDKSFTLFASVSGVNLSFTGTWSISSDEKIITLTTDWGGTSETTQLEILSLTSSALQLKENYNGITTNYTFSRKP